MEAGGRRHIRVLLVEDDEGDAFLVRELLTEVEAPVDLTVVSTIAEAIAAVDHVDCALLDLDLPDASGLDALRSLLSARPQVAVCVLTGLAEERLGAEALAHGAQDYLVKGRVDGVVLERALRYAVERRRAEDGALRLREAEFRQAESSRLERGLLPHPLIDELDVGVRTFYRAGRKLGLLGGDFVDAVQTGPQRISVVVGDVCGHAVEEAALGVELRVAWRALMIAGIDDDRVLATLERILVNERRADEIFTTIAMVGVDVAARRATVRVAGHPPPLFITGSSVTPLAVVQSAALGLPAGKRNEPIEIDMPDGAWGILAYTDGLIEARHGDDWLGTDGLCEMVEAFLTSGGETDELPGWLAAEAERRNGEPLADDVAMLLLTGRPVVSVPGPATLDGTPPSDAPLADGDRLSEASVAEDAPPADDRAHAGGHIPGGRS